MKIPNKMDKKMVAICGMNCTVCYKHLITKKYAKNVMVVSMMMKHYQNIVENAK